MSRSAGNVIETIRKKCLNCSKKYTDRKCKLNLTELPYYVVERADKTPRDEPMCDCIVFAEVESKFVVAVTELKARSTEVSKIESQLTNGLKLAMEILKKAGTKEADWKTYLICLAKKWHKSNHAAIGKLKIKLSGKEFRILPDRCGSKLMAIVSRKRSRD